MKPFRRVIALACVGAVGAATWGVGTTLVKDVQFARAENEVVSARSSLQSVNDLASAYKQVNHAMENSVVQIQVKKTIHAPLNNGIDPFRFFNRRGLPQMPGGPDDQDQDQDQGQQPDQELTEQATGSGVIMDAADGYAYIVTNNHVISDATTVDVLLNDGRHITDAKVVGADPKSDIAVVKIKADRVIPAKWGDSDSLEKGDIIVAFGSPFGYVGSMSHGIISALNRQAGVINGDFAYENFIQVDAAINPGNSGGPLVDLKGEVVGINTAIASRSGAFSGIGFAIPSNQAKSVYESLKKSGKVVRGYLGVQIVDVKSDAPEIKDSISAVGFKGENGVFVREVLNNSPAFNVLKPGDVITEIDGKPVKSLSDLRNRIANDAPNTEVKLKVWRDKSTQDVTVKLGEQPDSDQLAAATNAPARANNVGLMLTTPTDADIQAAGLPDGSQGALVKSVRPNSPAAAVGIQPGDLITKIGDSKVESAEDAKNALSKVDLKKGVRFDLMNRQGEKMVSIRIGR